MDIFEDFPINNDQVKRLAALCRMQVEQEDVVKDAEQTFKAAKKRLMEIQQDLIPNAMREAGVTSLDLENGESVKVTTKWAASISGPRREAAHKWLRENGHDALIKNDVIISFGKGEDKTAIDFKNACEGDNLVVDHKESIHSGTLKAFVKEQKTSGNDIPDDLFGIHEYYDTKIVRKK